jgi:hypothetical protein
MLVMPFLKIATWLSARDEPRRTFFPFTCHMDEL